MRGNTKLLHSAVNLKLILHNYTGICVCICVYPHMNLDVHVRVLIGQDGCIFTWNWNPANFHILGNLQKWSDTAPTLLFQCWKGIDGEGLWNYPTMTSVSNGVLDHSFSKTTEFNTVVLKDIICPLLYDDINLDVDQL